MQAASRCRQAGHSWAVRESEGCQRRNLHNNCQVTRCSATRTHLAPLLALALGQQLILALERIGDAVERRHDLAKLPVGDGILLGAMP